MHFAKGGMVVIVLEMVPAETAGVLFAVDPPLLDKTA
jgi:phosphoenolpyruvate synthase/pyruvate phosphate dikinase